MTPLKSGDDDEAGAWPDYFKLPVLMLMLITMLNDGTLISIGYDNVIPSKYPNDWNLPVLFTISSVLAGVALISSLILLWCMLASHNDGSILSSLGLGGLSYGQVTTGMYLKISISDFLTLFSARTHDGFFWSSTPSMILLVAAGFSLTLSTILASFWPLSNIDSQAVEGLCLSDPKSMPVWIWFYCIVWWFIQDAAKVVTYAYMEKHNILGINNANLIGAKTAGVSSTVTYVDEEACSTLKTGLLSNPMH